jgi:predicted nucleic acid-binding protein
VNVDSIVLDAQALTLMIEGDRKFMARIRAAREAGAAVVLSANTIVEVGHGKLNKPRYDWALSRVQVEEITVETARTAALLLKSAKMRGHRHAIDATVVETALRQPGTTVIYTSDPDGLQRLGDGKVHTIKV